MVLAVMKRNENWDGSGLQTRRSALTRMAPIALAGSRTFMRRCCGSADSAKAPAELAAVSIGLCKHHVGDTGNSHLADCGTGLFLAAKRLEALVHR